MNAGTGATAVSCVHYHNSILRFIAYFTFDAHITRTGPGLTHTQPQSVNFLIRFKIQNYTKQTIPFVTHFDKNINIHYGYALRMRINIVDMRSMTASLHREPWAILDVSPATAVYLHKFDEKNGIASERDE